MSSCKYCLTPLELRHRPSGGSSRRTVCDACRFRSVRVQADKAKDTKRQKASQQKVACRKCLCPILALRLDSGKQEQRRVCARCQEERPESKKATPQRKREQVKAWVAANKDRVRQVERAWKAANKSRISEDRRKLLIEDVQLVRAAAAAYRARVNKGTRDDA